MSSVCWTTSHTYCIIYIYIYIFISHNLPTCWHCRIIIYYWLYGDESNIQPYQNISKPEILVYISSISLVSTIQWLGKLGKTTCSHLATQSPLDSFVVPGRSAEEEEIRSGAKLIVGKGGGRAAAGIKRGMGWSGSFFFWSALNNGSDLQGGMSSYLTILNQDACSKARVLYLRSCFFIAVWR